MATDPVCGMELYESRALAQMKYNGVTYFFCSRKCLGRFEDNPRVYLGIAA